MDKDVKKKLKDLDHSSYPYKVYFQDDLTARRAKLAFEARQLKRSGAISDTWIANSKIIIKDNYNHISSITYIDGLAQDCGDPIADALELQWSCARPAISDCIITYQWLSITSSYDLINIVCVFCYPREKIPIPIVTNDFGLYVLCTIVAFQQKQTHLHYQFLHNCCYHQMYFVRELATEINWVSQSVLSTCLSNWKSSLCVVLCCIWRYHYPWILSVWLVKEQCCLMPNRSGVWYVFNCVMWNVCL